MWASPASAAGTTRWVDNGGNAGPSQCQGAQPYTSIQDAIDDAVPGDRIYVCPGTYHEQLRIDTPNLRIRSIVGRAALIHEPADLDEYDGRRSLIHINEVNKVVVRGFDLLIRSEAPCESLGAAILVDRSTSSVIRGNRIRVDGPDTMGPCGYDYGVVVTSEVFTPPSTAQAPSTLAQPASAEVLFNRMRDFVLGGVLIEGSNADALVWRNQIFYLHLAETINSVTDAGVCTSGFNCSFIGALGVGVENGASARVRGNLIKSGPDACPSCVTSTSTAGAALTPSLRWGITMMGLDGTDDPSRIVNNAIYRTSAGINITESLGIADIYRNRLTENGTGIEILDAQNVSIHDNRSTTNSYGIYLGSDTSNNTIADNDFMGNSQVDCTDATAVGRPTPVLPVANTWTNDYGEPDSPDGICTADDAP